MLRNLLFSLWLVVISFISYSPVQAAPDQPKTRFYIIKTNRLLGVAHMTVKSTQHYTGDLALAVRHERKAVALYLAKDYNTAIFHSRRCRELCLKIFNENKIKQPMDAKYNAEELALATDSPTNETLDQSLETSTLKDEDFMNGNMEVEVK